MYLPARGFLLDIPEMSVQTVFLQKLGMGAALHDLALIQHQNLIGSGNGFQLMCNHDHRTAFHQCFQCVLHIQLVFRIKGGGRLIQQQDRRVIDLLVCSKHAALTEKGVHQGRFAVVNVGDDSHVTKFVILLHSSVSLW